MLTDARIRSLTSGDKSYSQYNPHGLFLEVATRGSELWHLRFRFVGKSKLISLGLLPVVGVAEARRKRDRYLEQTEPADILPVLRAIEKTGRIDIAPQATELCATRVLVWKWLRVGRIWQYACAEC